MTPGIDFVMFATGGGANIEDMPPIWLTGSAGPATFPVLPVVTLTTARYWQGTFVASGVLTFIWQVLSIYVPDDGNLDNWVANFKAALQPISCRVACCRWPYLADRRRDHAGQHQLSGG